MGIAPRSERPAIVVEFDKIVTQFEDSTYDNRHIQTNRHR
jgi:hypothetical protein